MIAKDAPEFVPGSMKGLMDGGSQQMQATGEPAQAGRGRTTVDPQTESLDFRGFESNSFLFAGGVIFLGPWWLSQSSRVECSEFADSWHADSP
jgi:hypothetical protein